MVVVGCSVWVCISVILSFSCFSVTHRRLVRGARKDDKKKFGVGIARNYVHGSLTDPGRNEMSGAIS